MEWQLVPYAIPLFVGAALLIFTAFFALSRGSTLAAIFVAISNILLAVYVIGYGMELGQPTLSGVLFWSKIEYLGLATAPVAWFLLILAYTDRRKLISTFNILLLFAIPVTTIIFAWTNQYHEWIWKDLSLDRTGMVYLASFKPGPWYWVNVSYTNLLVLLSIVLLVRTYFRMPKLFRRQVIVLSTGLMAPVATYFVYLVALAAGMPLPGVNWQAYAFIITALIISLGVLNYQLFDIGPVARDAIFDDMDDSVIVIDKRMRIIDINPAAESTLSCDRTAVIGQSIHDLSLAGEKGLLGSYFNSEESRDEFSINGMVFDTSVSRLARKRGQSNGWLLVMRDISKRRQMEEEQKKLISDLQAAYNKVNTLSGLLPICANCKKIRDDKGYWHTVEVYVRDHSNAEFSHGICPDCLQELYPEFGEEKNGEENENGMTDET